MFLVLIETSGNQNYIFSTNKLRENVGASELTYRAGTEWVLKAVAEEGGPSLWDSDSKKLRSKLLDSKLNKSIDSIETPVEVILAASGKALLLTKTFETAKTIIRKVTCRALKEAPGLDICGTIKEFNWEESLGEINKKVHENFEQVRSRRPGPNNRFLRLPIIEECRTSGLPAKNILPDAQELVPRSAASQAKQNAFRQGFRRLAAFLKQRQTLESRKKPINFARSFRVLEASKKRANEGNLQWLAVIHADGNGLGEIFLKFHEHIGAINADSNRNYIDKLRRFSLAIDECTEQAFLEAINTLIASSVTLPVIPLVLGGDDLTVICDGLEALRFTQEFLKAFEQQTAKHPNGLFQEIAKTALNAPRLSACAGVAIVKPHFPFSVAYDLAEELMQSAKQVKKKIYSEEKKQETGEEIPLPCSALDFHVLYDTSRVELKPIRQKLIVDDKKTRLYGRPLITTEIQHLTGSTETGLDWVKLHLWKDLEKRVSALQQSDEEGNRLLPTSQMHDLRSGLFLGQAKADARLKLIWERYKDKGIKNLVRDASQPSLFWQEEDGNNHKVYVTDFLDAMEAVDFLPKHE